MKSSLLLSLYSVSFAAALAHSKDPQIVLQNPQVTIEEPDAYLIELSPGDTRWVTEEEKWALRRVCIRGTEWAIYRLSFVDIDVASF